MRSPGYATSSSDLLDVDRLRTLVAVLLLEGDLGAFAQRTVAVAGDAREVHEEIASSPVGCDEAEALLVREPLDRAGAHRYPHFDCSARVAALISTGRCVRS